MGNKYQVVSYNQQYLNWDSFKIDLTNRGLRYGDGFFETMHANGLDVQFVDDHFLRIIKAAKVLKIHLPEYFSLVYLRKQVSGLLSRCKLFQAARVKLTVLRSGEGLYIPQTSIADIIIEASFLGKGKYELNEQGITVGIYNEFAKPKLPYLQFKSLNAQIYVLASIFAQQNNYDDVLLVNETGKIVEATSSNFFAVREKNIYTPSLNTGCVRGVMRKQIIKIAIELGYNIHETDSIDEDFILQMDELFLTNAMVGTKFISGFKNRRYYNRNSKKIIGLLNEVAF